jgi:predicted dehydrogenase
MVAACLEAKIPVICEKALSSNSEEAAKLLALRDRHNGFLAVTYNYSGYPMVRELRRLIRSGILGRIIQFQAEMPQEGFIRTDPHGNKPKPQAWRLEDGRVPTLYLDLGAHLHHLLWYLTGESPLKVVAQQGTHGWFSDIIDNAGALCQYSGDVLGQFWFTKSALGHRNGLRLRLYGTEAACEWYQAAPEELLISHKDGRREIRDRAGDVGVANAIRYTRFKAGHPAGFIEAFSNIYTDIGECYDRYRATGLFQSEEVFSAELAFEGCRLLEAMHDSARKGAWETIGAGAGS